MKRVILIIIPSLVFGLIVFFGMQYFFAAPEKGALQVTATPESKVYANGKYLGQTPLCRCDSGNMLPVGDYTLQVSPVNGQFLPVEDKITLTKSVLTVVDKTFTKGAASEGSIISLTPLADSKGVQLTIVTIPDKATIFLDSEMIGSSPLSKDGVTESDHVINIQKDGYKDKTIRIHTSAGYKLLATVTLAVNDNISPTPIQAAITPTPDLQNAITPTPTIQPLTIQILQTPNGFLRVRDTASLAGNEIGRVTVGQTYTVQGEQNGWYEIKLQDGTLGWVSSQYTVKVTAQ